MESSQVAAMKETESDGNSDVPVVQQHPVPELRITPATAESTPAPPDTVDESLLVPPTCTKAKPGSISRTEESSPDPANSGTDEHATIETPGDAGTSPTKQPRVRNDRKSPFTAKFFGDMLNTIDSIFPYQKFAEEHDCTVGDVHRALMATVFTPLTDANERGKPRIAEKGRTMMKRWNQQYKEMVAKLNEESNERRFPMEFEQVLIAASQNLDAYWESRNSGFEAYKSFQNTKKKQNLEDRSTMLKRAAERDVELTQEATEARRKRSKSGEGASSSSVPATDEASSSINNIEHVDLTDSASAVPAPSSSSPSGSQEKTKRSTKRHPVLVDAFGNYQDMPEVVSNYFDKQYQDMAAGTYVPSSASNDFGKDTFDEDMVDDDDEDGDYEDEEEKGGRKRRRRDSIDRMLDILRQAPRRSRRRSLKSGQEKEAEKEKFDEGV